MASQAISAQGTTFEISTDGGSTTEEIGEVKSYSGFDGSSEELDVTSLQSTSKEFVLGLQDNGSLQLDVNVVKEDVGQKALMGARASGNKCSFTLTYPLRDGDTTAAIDEFEGYVQQFSQQGGVDAVQEGTVQIRITGDVTYTEAS